jgi:hypothetical protein
MKFVWCLVAGLGLGASAMTSVHAGQASHDAHAPVAVTVPKAAPSTGSKASGDSKATMSVGKAPTASSTPGAGRASGATTVVTGSGINGTGLAHPGSSTTAVGGPGKSATGVLNGSNMSPKHR